MVYVPERAVTPTPLNVRTPLVVEALPLAIVAPADAETEMVVVLPSPVVTVLSQASRTSTIGWVSNEAPDALLPVATLDLLVTTTLLGVPAVTVSELLLTVSVVVEESAFVRTKENCSACAPAVPVIERSANVATPFTGVAVVVPRNVPLPLARDTVTAVATVVTVLP